jgi:hypothetical protein
MRSRQRRPRYLGASVSFLPFLEPATGFHHGLPERGLKMSAGVLQFLQRE